MQKTNNKLSLTEKVGYACGDVASNFYWRVFDVFLLIFYTDVFGLSAASVGTMILVTRIIDAFSDPLMGAISDRTNTKFGKFRPYLLIGILPLIAAGILVFTVPDISTDGKLVWAYCTYIFMMLAYTFINVPYGALMGVMTSDSQDRTALTSFRFIGAFTGGSIVAYFTPALVNWLGQGNEVLGWQLTMTFYGLLAAVLFTLSFLTTKERIQAPKDQQNSVSQDITDLLANKPWLVLFALALIIMMTITLRASSGTFYLKYVIGEEALIGSFTLTYMLALTAGAAITPFLTKFVDKRTLLMLLMFMVAVLSSLFYYLPTDNLLLIFVIHGAIGFCLGPKSPLVFSMYADTADYNQWRTGRRATAMTFAAAAFSQKLGGAMAGATIGWMLGALGYVANQAQTQTSNEGILLLMSIIPACFALVAAMLVKFYSLTEQRMSEIQDALNHEKRHLTTLEAR